MGQTPCEYTARRLSILTVLFALVFGMWLVPMEIYANVNNALWLSVAPAASVSGPACDLHGNPVAQKSKGSNQRGGRPQKPQRFESEHRPIPMRTYYLNGPLSPQAEAYALHPDGSSEQLKINYDPQPSLTFKTPMADDRLHGANNIYVIDKQVINGVLTVQSAKWLSIHHSCGWGHDYRNDPTRKTAHGLAQIPLEIVINGLWDGNFHSEVRSGDVLAIAVTSKGAPAKGASVTVTSDKQWSHSAVTDRDGIATIQLIRDYYPTGWAQFKRTQQGRFTVTAEYRKDEIGQYNNQPYQQIHYIATFPWKYSPAQADYMSYAFGLGLGTLAMAFSGIGIYSFRQRRKRPYKEVNLG